MSQTWWNSKFNQSRVCISQARAPIAQSEEVEMHDGRGILKESASRVLDFLLDRERTMIVTYDLLMLVR